jgi:acetyl-CoA acyltransferase
MRDAVIVQAVRTPVGTRHGGPSGLHPADLSAQVLAALAGRAGIDPAMVGDVMVDDVIWGYAGPPGEQASGIARHAVLAAGWPQSVPGVTVDRQCGSSQQAVSFAAASVIAGHCDVVVAGGVECTSRVPADVPGGRQPPGAGFPDLCCRTPPGQGEAAETIAERWSLSRGQLDDFSLGSHAKAAAAQDDGWFTAEIAPVAAPGGTMIDADEGIRRGRARHRLAGLEPAVRPGGAITAGHSSPISDGAAAVLITTSDRAAQLGFDPLVRVHTCVAIAGGPVTGLTAPIAATARALARSGLSLEDIGVFEVNEAFAPVPLAWIAETGTQPALVNPNGGAIALGHPRGGSGTRLMTTMIHHMLACGTRYGLQAMGDGGGQANATILELL